MKKISAWSLCLLLLSAIPAAAQQSGKAALDKWIENIRDFGFVQEYGSATEDGNKVVFKDIESTFQTSFQIESDGEPMVVNIEYSDTVPELVATRLSHNGEGLSADSMEFTDDVEFDIEIKVDGNAVLSYQGSIENYRLKGVFWPDFRPLPKGVKGSVREWVTWFSALADIRIDEAAASALSVRVATSEGTFADGSLTTDFEISDYELKGVWDGRVASYRIGKQRQEINYDLENGAPYSELVTIDSQEAKNIDFLAMFDLLDPKPAGRSEYVEVIEMAAARGYRAESDLYEVFVEKINYENIAVRSPETDLIGLVEQALAGKEPNESEIVAAVLDLYRSFSIGSISVEDVLVGFDADSEVGSGGVDRISLSNLSADGLGEFAVEGVGVDAGQHGSFRLGRFSVGKVKFAPYGPLKAFLNDSSAWDNPDPLEVARVFSPLSFATELKGLMVASPELSGDIVIDDYKVEMSTTVPPIPTNVVLSTEGLELPVAFLNDPKAEAFLKAAGIEVLRFSEIITLNWDEATEDLVIDNFVVDVGQVGRISARARLGGLPKALLENPARLEAAIVTLNLKSIDIEIENEGGVETALALSAADADVSEGMMKEALLMQLEGALAMVGNQAFSEQVMTAARSFFDNPQTLKLRAVPDQPVPVSQIMSDAMIAPDMLPERLGVSIEASR